MMGWAAADLQVNYFKNRRVSEYEKEQLLKRHEEEYLKKN
jgi:hypothetical protein